MKRILTIIFIGFSTWGCTDNKAQEKALFDDIIKVHDKVMGADEQLMKNKMKLDTLSKQNNFPGKDTAKMLSDKLNIAENAMENWMHKFSPERNGKSHDETVAYMSNQKKQIAAIDSQINTAIAESNKYLTKIKAK